MEPGKEINAALASRLRANFISKYGEDITRGQNYDVDIFSELKNMGAETIWLDLGLKQDGELCIIIQAADKGGKRLENCPQFEFGKVCPPFC